MDVKIDDTKDVKALSRKEVSGMVTFEGATPSKDNLKKQLASQLKAGEDTVVIKLIKTVFGHTKAVFNAYVYDKPEMVAMYERKTKKQREAEAKAAADAKKDAETKAAEETAPVKEAPKEEKPPAELKEEEKAEEPKKEE